MGLLSMIRNHFTDNYSSHKRFENSRGYIKVFRDGKYVYEHRYKIEQKLKRPLRSDEVVHHHDRNRWNNDLSNLEVMPRWDHDDLHGFHKHGYPKNRRR